MDLTVKYILKGAAYSTALRAHFLTDATLVKHMMGANNSTSLDETLKDLEETSRTAKLWVLYYQLVRTVQEFILPERLHDWQGHLNVVAKMLGIFAAAGAWPVRQIWTAILTGDAEISRTISSGSYR